MRASSLAYARKLKDAGVDEVQAEAHAEAMRDAVTEGVATKADVGVLKTDVGTLKAAFEHLATKAELAAVKADIGAVKWVLGILAALVIAVAGRLFGVF